MLDEDHTHDDGAAEELLRRALLDDSAGGRRLAAGRRAAAQRGGDGHLPRPPRSRHAADLRHLRQPRRRGDGRRPASCCASPATWTSPTPRTAPRPSGSTSSRRRRCATRSSAPTPCSTCGASRCRDLAGSGVDVDHSVQLSVRLPAPRLLPTALVATESQLVVTPVCSARTLADGRPPMGIACAQQDFTRVYPLADDPERCVEDFLELAAEHALRARRALEHQEASVQRFLELSDS